MVRKSKGLLKNLRDGYKKLPLRERVKVLVQARKVLEKQREGKRFASEIHADGFLSN